MHRSTFLRSLALAAALAGSFAADARTLYAIDHVVPLAAVAPSWDYIGVDPTRPLIYLGRRADGVTVFDTDKQQVVGSIERSKGANATVLIPEFDRGYTVNNDGSSTVFQLSTLKTLDRLTLSDTADNAFYDPKTKQIVFTMGDNKELMFVDAKTGAKLGTLAMEADELEGAAVDGRGAIFVNERTTNTVTKVDIATRQVLSRWPVTGCEQPTGMAYDIADERLFLGCKGDKPVLAVMNATSGKVVKTLEIGRGNDGVVYDPDAHKVFASNGLSANLVVFDQLDPDTYTLAQAVTTRPTARTLAMDPRSKRLFTMTADGGFDPTKKSNSRAGSFYPNTFAGGTFVLLELAPKTVP